jgi:hypothetical protein
MEADKAKFAKDIEALESSLSQQAEDRSRKIEKLLRHYERQIEEFYGPLFNMTNQIFAAWHVQHEILSASSKHGEKIVQNEMAEKIRDYFYTTYFWPLHDEIREILKTKLYLVEGSEVPSSFHLYLKHAAQERDQRMLWKLHQIDTSFVPGEPWPKDFYRDIKMGFENAMQNYEQCLSGLKAQHL